MPAKVDADDRRRRLTLAAAELIADEGIGALTNQRIAERLAASTTIADALFPQQARTGARDLPSHGDAVTCPSRARDRGAARRPARRMPTRPATTGRRVPRRVEGLASFTKACRSETRSSPRSGLPDRPPQSSASPASSQLMSPTDESSRRPIQRQKLGACSRSSRACRSSRSSTPPTGRHTACARWSISNSTTCAKAPAVSTSHHGVRPAATASVVTETSWVRPGHARAGSPEGQLR